MSYVISSHVWLYLDSNDGPLQINFPLEYNEGIGGKTQDLSLDCFPPPQLLEHCPQSDHSVKIGHFCELQTSLSKSGAFPQGFEFFRWFGNSHLLFLVLSPLPQVLLHDVHGVHGVNSIK